MIEKGRCSGGRDECFYREHKKRSLDLLILLTLGDTLGPEYAIATRIDANLRGFLRFDAASLYPICS